MFSLSMRDIEVARMSTLVQVFGCCAVVGMGCGVGRRPKSAKARNRGMPCGVMGIFARLETGGRPRWTARTVGSVLGRSHGGVFVVLGASGAVRRDGPVSMGDRFAWRGRTGSHELSMASGIGRCLGWQPGSKTSMMIMAPPQQGQA